MSTTLDVLLGVRAGTSGTTSVTNANSRSNLVEQTFAELSAEWMHLIAAERSNPITAPEVPSDEDSSALEPAVAGSATGSSNSVAETVIGLIGTSRVATNSLTRSAAAARALGVAGYQDSSASAHSVEAGNLSLEASINSHYESSVDMGLLQNDPQGYQSLVGGRSNVSLKSDSTSDVGTQEVDTDSVASKTPALDLLQASNSAMTPNTAAPQIADPQRAAPKLTEAGAAVSTIDPTGNASQRAVGFDSTTNQPTALVTQDVSVSRQSASALGLNPNLPSGLTNDSNSGADLSLQSKIETAKIARESGVEQAHLKPSSPQIQHADTGLPQPTAVSAPNESLTPATVSTVDTLSAATRPVAKYETINGTPSGTIAIAAKSAEPIEHRHGTVLESTGKIEGSSGNELGLLRLRSGEFYSGDHPEDRHSRSRRGDATASRVAGAISFGSSGSTAPFSTAFSRAVQNTATPSHVRDVSSFVVEQVRSANLEKGITVELRHPELGVVRLSAMLENGQVRISLQAQWEQTAAMLAFHKDEMQQLMHNSGLHGARCSVSWENESNPGYSSDDQYPWDEQPEEETDHSRGYHRSDSERSRELNLML